MKKIIVLSYGHRWVVVGAAASIYSNEEPEYIPVSKNRGSYLTSMITDVSNVIAPCKEDRWGWAVPINKARGKPSSSPFTHPRHRMGSLCTVLSRRLMMMPARVQMGVDALSAKCITKAG